MARVAADPGAAVALLTERVRRLAVAPSVRERAAALIKAEGVPGMDEPRVNQDWVNDVLGDREASTYREASADPAGAYLSYVSDRIAQPYHVSFRAVRQLAKQTTEDETNSFVHVRWHQELAWARRLRASGEDRIAILSQLFLRAAARDPGKVFSDLAGAWSSAIDDIRFATAPEHDLSEDAIRAVVGEPSYRPAFLRHYEARHSAGLDGMSDAQIRHAASQARSAEEAERRGEMSAASVVAARRSPLSHILGVLRVAHSTGRSSCALVRDERRFLADVLRGRLPKAVHGLPYHDFITWLYATPVGEPPEPVAIGDAEHSEMARILAMPVSWLSRLPEAYCQLGAGEVDTFRAWASPLAAGTAPVPRDAVADYGLHLVRTRHRLPA